MTYVDSSAENQLATVRAAKCNAESREGKSNPPAEQEWFELIRPDFTQSNISVLAGAKKLIKAKKALKKRNGSFTRLVERLGMDLGKAERLMKIARHPVLADSAHAPTLPVSWMTLYCLSALSPKILEGLIADGTVHPGLERKEAERLVRKIRSSNSNGRSDRARDDGDGGADCGDGRGGDHDHGGGHDNDRDPNRGDDRDADHGGDARIENALPAQTVADDTIGPDSRSELERKLARLEELENETRRQAIQVSGYESEIEELKAKLGPESTLRHQRRLFRQAIQSLQEADKPGALEKESRFLKQSATSDLVELVRATIRDGINPNRLDLFYRPELH